MIITNPFTRQVLNTNPEGCNQYSGPECSGHSQIRSLKDSIGALGKEAEDSARILQHFDSPLDSPLLFQHAGEKARIAGVVRDYRIHTLGPYPREVAAHELGHVKLGHTTDQSRLEEHLDQVTTGKSPQETEAWRWAMKNRKKLGLSKRKMLRIARGTRGNELDLKRVLK